MSATDQRIRELVTQRAAEWFIDNREGLPPHRQADFAAWLQCSPLHIEEYLAIAGVGRDLRAASEMSQEALDELVERARSEPETSTLPMSGTAGYAPHDRVFEWPRWKLTAVALAAVLVSLLGVLMFRHSVPADTRADSASLLVHYATRHGEQQSQRLTDGSVIQLNTDSDVTVRFSKNERLVQLNAGEVDFEIAPERIRPFRVIAGAAQITAIGTTFDVRLRQRATVVTVTQGRVAVGPSHQPPYSPSNANMAAGFVQMGANQQISVDADSWPAVPVPANSQQTTAWLQRQIRFQNQTLGEVVNELNRYAPIPFEITASSLRSLRISGVLATDDPDAWIAFLRSLEGVRVDVTPTRIRVKQEPGRHS